MVCRSAKHLFNRYMHCTDTTNIAAGIAHFLNCLLSSCSLPTSSPYSGDSPNSTQNKAAKKKSKKGKSKQAKDNALGMIFFSLGSSILHICGHRTLVNACIQYCRDLKCLPLSSNVALLSFSGNSDMFL